MAQNLASIKKVNLQNSQTKKQEQTTMNNLQSNVRECTNEETVANGTRKISHYLLS